MMNDGAGHQEFVKASATHIVEELSQASPETTKVISAATGAASDADIDQHRTELVKAFTEIRDKATGEESQAYVHYASRFDIVGVYQSVLSHLLNQVPGMQGYGNRNPVWVTTLIEQGIYKLESFFHEVRELDGQKKSLFQAIIEAWREVKLINAPYPPGVPTMIPLPEECNIALLADWGGDNPAAKNVAAVVTRAQPGMAIHLGDIYYGGVKEECEAFLCNWPLQSDSSHPGNGVPPGSSLALNGNHEMYSGGESFFKVVLPAFGQPQPFFCLENQYWRIIGLDTAYLNGRLKPQEPNDSMWVQWNWLVDLLKNGFKRANIILSHHQPVSAHKQEFTDSQKLRDDVSELLAMEGIGADAIYGWFFGHEHRTTVYKNDAAPYLARLIGSGCIPHEIQTEVSCDPGFTPFQWVSGRGEDGTQSAISLYAELRFVRNYLLIVYTDERSTSLGTEEWDSTKRPSEIAPFVPDKTTYLP